MHWLPLSLSVTHSVTFSRLDWCDPGLWRCQLKTCWWCYFVMLLMMRIVLATVCCRFGSWDLVIKQNFCLDFEDKVWSRFWSWSSGKIWSWSLISILLLMFCRGFEVKSWESRFWSWSSGLLCPWQCLFNLLLSFKEPVCSPLQIIQYPPKPIHSCVPKTMA